MLWTWILSHSLGVDYLNDFVEWTSKSGGKQRTTTASASSSSREISVLERNIFCPEELHFHGKAV